MEVEQVAAFRAMDGSLHESMAQAVARNITMLPGRNGLRGSPWTVAVAWSIIEHRATLVALLAKLDGHPVVLNED